MRKLIKAMRPLRRRVNQMLGRDLPYRAQFECDKLRLGSDYGGWSVCPKMLNRQSIAYSFGVGDDISFDLALVNRFGLSVHAFDPTPKAVRWIKTQQTPAQFIFHNLGLADFDGEALFHEPKLEHVSYRMASSANQSASIPTVACPVRRLQTIMAELNHTHIDLLKMDIEGAEYDALQNILTDGIRITQLLVEFHHVVGDRASLDKTRNAVESLQSAGYRIFDVSPVGLEFGFLHAN